MSQEGDTLVSIAVTYIREEIKGIEGLEARFERACREAHKFWLSTDDDVRMKAAIAATRLETVDQVEVDRLERSAGALAAVARMLQSGRLDANIDAELNFPPGFVPLKVLQIWMDTKKEAIMAALTASTLRSSEQ